MRESILNIKCSPEAREKCPFDHPCDSDERAYFEEGSACDIFNKKLIPPPPPTNTDHIRSLGDEEMASCMDAFSFCPPDIEEDKLCYKDADCEKCWLDWLKQPYKEDT